MGTRTGSSKTKSHKPKVEKKKKKEEKILPVVLEITVKIPEGKQIVLKGISTDRILDVRRLLRVHVETCHLTNYSLSHQVRGNKLRDSLEVAILKPCILEIVQDEYTEEQCVVHVQRLLDIIACTTCFGPSGVVASVQDGSEQVQLNNDRAEVSDGAASCTENKLNVPGRKYALHSGNGKSSKQLAMAGKFVKQRRSLQEKPEAMAAIAAAKEATERGDMTGMCPPSRLALFYEFFSFSHLTAPIQALRRSTKRGGEEGNKTESFFTIDVKLCNGKTHTIFACQKGFYNAGKQSSAHSFSLVSLLQRLSKAFANAYDDLMKAFSERNKFGNLPFGLRANTWVVPPLAADTPIFPLLPVEDENWGGNGGGFGRDGKDDTRCWARDLAVLAAMPCNTPEERQIRDRKTFLLHSLFVDVAVINAALVIQRIASEPECWQEQGSHCHEEICSNLRIMVYRDIPSASCKLPTKIDFFHSPELSVKDLGEKNLLKGITADESTTIHDTSTSGVVIIRHQGFTAIVRVVSADINQSSLPDDIVIEDQPEGGANALNVNSLRVLLHSEQPAHASKSSEMVHAKHLVSKVLEDGLSNLIKEDSRRNFFLRWELGACWVQHLRTQAEDEKSGQQDKKHIGTIKCAKHGEHKCRKLVPSNSEKSCKNNKDERMQQEPSFEKGNGDDDHLALSELTDSAELKSMLSAEAYKRLKESGTGLHSKPISLLTEDIQTYYEDVALPKLVSDFGSLELSPVDGRTLTDFMHTRGLRMCSLGRVVKLAEKLPHVQSLCIHEMVTRAYKHLLRAVIAATPDASQLAASIAASLNLMLGSGASQEEDVALNRTWRWVEVFLGKRFGWKLESDAAHRELRKFAVLRGLCHKVGLELASCDYNMDCSMPFQQKDIISMVPVYKQVACSSADGRTLLESSKTALDKGKLDDAVTYGTKALAKLVAVCGPYHRMTAGAYSLLAVVLYHTGDFNQATIYQQKALDINERELGLDHPDTMKSYGDLAVFYYRLQHTELALKYVNRTLYLLHLTCGPAHPNTAATYINVAMMEEGLGNVHVALRYLHEALKCNQRLLGADHIQTAASYHAIAIALSLMEAYTLSVQHEQTTLHILQAKLGPDDLRTQDAAAWLEYFESKAVEQQEALQKGTPKPDVSIASKGLLSVSDLLDYINADAETNAKEAEVKKKSSRNKCKGKGAQSTFESPLPMSGPNDVNNVNKDNVMDLDVQPPNSPPAMIVPREESRLKETTMDIPESCPLVTDSLTPGPSGTVQNMENANDGGGWQEAVPRGRYVGGPLRSFASRQRTAPRLTTNAANSDAKQRLEIVRQIPREGPSRCSIYAKRKAAPSLSGYSSAQARGNNPTTFKKPFKALHTQLSSSASLEDTQPASQSGVVSRHDPVHVTVATPERNTERVRTLEQVNAIVRTFESTSEIQSKEDLEPAGNPLVSLKLTPSYKEVALAPPGKCARAVIGHDMVQNHVVKSPDQLESLQTVPAQPVVSEAVNDEKQNIVEDKTNELVSCVSILCEETKEAVCKSDTQASGKSLTTVKSLPENMSLCIEHATHIDTGSAPDPAGSTVTAVLEEHVDDIEVKMETEVDASRIGLGEGRDMPLSNCENRELRADSAKVLPEGLENDLHSNVEDEDELKCASEEILICEPEQTCMAPANLLGASNETLQSTCKSALRNALSDVSTKLSAEAPPYNPAHRIHNNDNVGILPMKYARCVSNSGVTYARSASMSNAHHIMMALTPIHRPPCLRYNAWYPDCASGQYSLRSVSGKHECYLFDKSSVNDCYYLSSGHLGEPDYMHSGANVHIPHYTMNPYAAEFIPGRFWQPFQSLNMQASHTSVKSCFDVNNWAPSSNVAGIATVSGERAGECRSQNEHEHLPNVALEKLKLQPCSITIENSSNSDKLWADLGSGSDSEIDRGVPVSSNASAVNLKSILNTKGIAHLENGIESSEFGSSDSGLAEKRDVPSASQSNVGDGFMLVTKRRARPRNQPYRYVKGTVYSYYRQKGTSGGPQSFKNTYRPVIQERDSNAGGDCFSSGQPQVVSIG